MKCHYHPEYEAVSTCSKCGQPICKTCEYFNQPKPVCLTCYEEFMLNLPKTEYKPKPTGDKRAIVIPAVVVIGTGLFAWGTSISCSGLMIMGVILLAVSILGLR